MAACWRARASRAGCPARRAERLRPRAAPPTPVATAAAGASNRCLLMASMPGTAGAGAGGACEHWPSKVRQLAHACSSLRHVPGRPERAAASSTGRCSAGALAPARRGCPATAPVDALASSTTAACVVTVSCLCALAAGAAWACPMARKLQGAGNGVVSKLARELGRLRGQGTGPARRRPPPYFARYRPPHSLPELTPPAAAWRWRCQPAAPPAQPAGGRSRDGLVGRRPHVWQCRRARCAMPPGTATTPRPIHSPPASGGRRGSPHGPATKEFRNGPWLCSNAWKQCGPCLAVPG